MKIQRLVSLVSASVAAAVCAAGTASAQSAEAILKRAAETYQDAQTLAVAFDQTVTNPLTDRSAESHGELLRKRPNLLSVNFASPADDRIVADGSDLWIYLPSTAPGQVIRVPAAAQRGMLVDPMGQVLTAPAERYAVAPAGVAVVSGRATHAITLTPRSQPSLFTRATLWVDDADGQVRRIETTEPSGLVRTVTITRLRRNISVPRSAFRFTPPPNVRVLDQRRILGG